MYENISQYQVTVSLFQTDTIFFSWFKVGFNSLYCRFKMLLSCDSTVKLMIDQDILGCARNENWFIREKVVRTVHLWHVTESKLGSTTCVINLQTFKSESSLQIQSLSKFVWSFAFVCLANGKSVVGSRRLFGWCQCLGNDLCHVLLLGL